MRWSALGFAVALVLALVETRALLGEVEERWVVGAAVAAGAAVALLAVRLLSPGLSLVAVALALVVPWPFFVVLLLAGALTDHTPVEWINYPVWIFQLALPVAAAGLAAAQFVRLVPQRASYASALGVLAGAGLSLAFAAPAAEWLDEPPRARYATIEDRRGAYGTVALGDSPDELFAGFGEQAPSGFNESMTPLGADEFEGPTFIPIEASDDVYRYDDVVFWLHADEIKGFEITSPGAITSRGIAVGDDLDAVRDAYPALECGDAPAGDVATYPYCSGRIAPERWVWFGGDPVSTITFSSRSFE